MIKASILGATGYGGVELVRLLVSHPEVDIAYVAGHSTVGLKYHEVYPQFSGVFEMAVEEVDVGKALSAGDVVFSCLEHGVGTEIVGQLVDEGAKVIDFSADFRLSSVEVYEQHYKPHARPDLVGNAVYGLPELHREEIKQSSFVAVPGCYPTGAILALAPLASKRVIDPASCVADSKSGTSGAGRTKTDYPFRFCERNESMTAYGIGKHRHGPEMAQELSFAAGEEVYVLFSPHLIPITRGILTTAYATLTDGSLDAAKLQGIYESYYRDEPFVRVCQAGKFPTTKQVTGTNFCDVGVTFDGRSGRAIAVSAVCNLGKGLSAAAVQCMNLMFGLPETTGLMGVAIWP